MPKARQEYKNPLLNLPFQNNNDTDFDEIENVTYGRYPNELKFEFGTGSKQAFYLVHVHDPEIPLCVHESICASSEQLLDPVTTTEDSDPFDPTVI